MNVLAYLTVGVAVGQVAPDPVVSDSEAALVEAYQAQPSEVNHAALTVAAADRRQKCLEGEPASSLPHCRAFLALTEACRDSQHPDVATALGSLAVQLKRAGRNREAAPLLRRVVAIAESTGSPEGLGLVKIYETLIVVLEALGKHDEIESLQRRALAIEETILEPGHPDISFRLNELAVSVVNQGRRAEAQELYQRSLALAEAAGLDPVLLGIRLYNLGQIHQVEGRYDEAESVYRRAVDQLATYDGPSAPYLADLLSNLAEVLRGTGRYEEAIPFARQALASLEQDAGTARVTVGIQLYALANLHREAGRLDEAERLARRSLATRESELGSEHPLVARVQNSLGRILQETGQHAEAESLFRRAIAVTEAALGSDHPDLGPIWGNLAWLLRQTNRLDEAEDLYRRALVVAQRALGPEHPVVIQQTSNLAGLLSETGRHADAEEMLRRCVVLAEKVYGPTHPEMVAPLGNLAMLLRDTGRFAEAEATFRRSLGLVEAALSPDHPRVAQQLNNLALLLLETRRPAEAEPLLRRALSIWESAFAPHHPLVARGLNSLGGLLLETGRFDESEVAFRRSIAATRTSLGPDHPIYALRVNNLGTLLSKDPSRFDDAESLLQEALRVSEAALGPDHPHVAARLRNLSTLRILQGRAAEALPLRSRALELEETELQRTLFVGTNEQRRLRLRQFESTTDGILTLHQQYLPSSPEATKLALGTVLRRKGRLYELERDTLQLVRVHEDPEGVQLLEQYREAVAQLSVLLEDAPGEPEALAAWREECDTRSRQIDTLQRRLSSRSAAFRRATERVTLERVASTLRDGSALLELAVYEPWSFESSTWEPKRYVGFLLLPNGQVTSVDLGRVDAMDNRVRALRQALVVPGRWTRGLSPAADPRRDVQAAARALFEAVLRPFWGDLDSVNQLYVASDGLLNLVPLEVLVHGIEDDAPFFSYLTSGRELLSFDAEHPRPMRPVVIYDVDFGEADRAEGGPSVNAAPTWPSLPGAAREGRWVTRALRRARQLRGSSATESAVKTLQRPKLLHVASHGYFNAARSPEEQTFSPLLRSGVVLAGANRPPDGGDNGLLTAAELSGLDLRGTSLVVLSACETGTGEVRDGDGVHGLRRAIGLAGARAQVLSLWRVDDEATASLIRAFYRQLRRGRNVGEALRRAKATIRADLRWAHPYYWAAFTASGDATTTL